MRGVRKDYLEKSGREHRSCAQCKEPIRRRYQDKLCGKCYLKKKRQERKNKPDPDTKISFWLLLPF